MHLKKLVKFCFAQMLHLLARRNISSTFTHTKNQRASWIIDERKVGGEEEKAATVAQVGNLL